MDSKALWASTAGSKSENYPTRPDAKLLIIVSKVDFQGPKTIQVYQNREHEGGTRKTPRGTKRQQTKSSRRVFKGRRLGPQNQAHIRGQAKVRMMRTSAYFLNIYLASYQPQSSILATAQRNQNCHLKAFRGVESLHLAAREVYRVMLYACHAFEATWSTLRHQCDGSSTDPRT